MEGPRAARLDFDALIEGIALKMAVEIGAAVIRVPGAVALRYQTPLAHPWPRAVDFSLEILAVDLESAVTAREASIASARETHCAHVFGCDVVADADEIEAVGYDGCWNTRLLALDLAHAQSSAASRFVLERVEKEAQVDELNALGPDFPSYLGSLGRPEFFDLLGRRDGRAVAKGQIVCASPDAAYVADMFTAQVARNTGCAGALLSGLHDEARVRGLGRTVLIPSQAASEAGFYEKWGYQHVSTDAVLLSKE